MSDPDATVRRSVERFADLAVYAPIGLAVHVARWVPDLAATGRARAEERVAVARVVGQMAVTMGSKELKRRFWPDDHATQGGDASSPSDAASASTPADDERTHAPDGAAGGGGGATASSSVAERGGYEREGDEHEPEVPSAAALPITDYESLAASQVVARLASLDAAELGLVERFERAHRRRRTVLGKIEQLRR